MTKWINARTSEKQKSTILTQLDSYHREQVQQNRQYLQVIIECLMFTAQQNIAQRGHEEERDKLGKISDSNRGNFLELLSLRCKDLPWLEKKLDMQLQNHAQWTSPSIQNELLTIMAEHVLKLIVADVKKSGKFAIIVDETSDIARTEQVALCLSYLADGKKQEAFIGFYDTKSTEGEVLYQLVKKALNDLELDIKNIVGQCYDGAANMCGIYKGLATQIKTSAPNAIYVHCYGHLLNLAIQDTMTNTKPLRNALGTIQSLYVFLEASPKRHAVFNDIEIEGKPIVQSLKSQSVTRWACHWVAVKAVHDELERIVKALCILADSRDAKTYTDSRSLLRAICDFEFVFGLCLLKVILSSTSSLSKYLQGKNIDVIAARRNASLTIKSLQGCREENQFQLVWGKAKVLCENLKIWIAETEFTVNEAKVPRRKPSRRHQALVGEKATEDITENTPESHHRVNTYFCSLDKVVSELETRFQRNDQDILCSLGDIILNEKPSDTSFENVASFYKLDQDLLEADFRIFKTFKEEHEAGELITAAEVYAATYEADVLVMLPELSKIIEIFTVIPATSCTAERAFSALRRVKTYLRNTMCQSRITSLALLNIERFYANKVVSHLMDSIIDTFGKRKGRDSFFF